MQRAQNGWVCFWFFLKSRSYNTALLVLTFLVKEGAALLWRSYARLTGGGPMSSWSRSCSPQSVWAPSILLHLRIWPHFSGITGHHPAFLHTSRLSGFCLSAHSSCFIRLTSLQDYLEGDNLEGKFERTTTSVCNYWVCRWEGFDFGDEGRWFYTALSSLKMGEDSAYGTCVLDLPVEWWSEVVFTCKLKPYLC